MKRNLILPAIFYFVCLTVFILGSIMPGIPGKTACEAGEKGKIKPIEKQLLGEWEIAHNKCTKEGKLIFYKSNKYKIFQKDYKGTGSGYNGEYKLDTTKDPVTIDLCLGECGKPGSKWTTRFGILQFLSDNKMEIRTSSSGKYPKTFSDDKNECYTLILTKKGEGKI